MIYCLTGGPPSVPFLLDPTPAPSQPQRACDEEGRTIYRKYWCPTLKIGFLLTLRAFGRTTEASVGSCDLSAPHRLGRPAPIVPLTRECGQTAPYLFVS